MNIKVIVYFAPFPINCSIFFVLFQQHTGNSIGVLDIFGFEDFGEIIILNNFVSIMPTKGYNTISINMCSSMSKKSINVKGSVGVILILTIIPNV